MYYRYVVSKVTFSRLDSDIWHKLYRWTMKKNSNKSTGQTVEKYFMRGKRKWEYSDKTGYRVSKLSTIPIKRFVKINNDHRVYDVKSKEYWEQREYQNAKNSILGSGALSLLFGKQKGKCAFCKQPFTNEEINSVEFHKHHTKPRSKGGDEKSSNLRLLHIICHQNLHAMYTRKEMSEYTDSGIDYLRLMKPSPKSSS